MPTKNDALNCMLKQCPSETDTPPACENDCKEHPTGRNEALTEIYDRLRTSLRSVRHGISVTEFNGYEDDYNEEDQVSSHGKEEQVSKHEAPVSKLADSTIKTLLNIQKKSLRSCL